MMTASSYGRYVVFALGFIAAAYNAARLVRDAPPASEREFAAGLRRFLATGPAGDNVGVDLAADLAVESAVEVDSASASEGSAAASSVEFESQQDFHRALQATVSSMI